MGTQEGGNSIFCLPPSGQFTLFATHCQFLLKWEFLEPFVQKTSKGWEEGEKTSPWRLAFPLRP
jgi:hypothetical protein